MSKSEKTYELEEAITLALARPNRIGCPEVTLDDWGIVDFVCMDIGGEQTVRCYELKITKSDFLSDAKKTFIGDYNYYVIPDELWMSVKGHVEKGIGVWVVDSKGNARVKKKAAKMKCRMPRSRVLGKILRALNRENIKHAEQSLHEKQLSKKTKDQVGAQIDVGDYVNYDNGEYEVASIDYSRDGTALMATLTIRNEHGNQLQVAPAIIRKVRASDIIA